MLATVNRGMDIGFQEEFSVKGAVYVLSVLETKMNKHSCVCGTVSMGLYSVIR